MNSLIVFSNFVFAIISIKSEREIAEFSNKNVFYHDLIPEMLKGLCAIGCSKIVVGKFYLELERQVRKTNFGMHFLSLILEKVSAAPVSK